MHPGRRRSDWRYHRPLRLAHGVLGHNLRDDGSPCRCRTSDVHRLMSATERRIGGIDLDAATADGPGFDRRSNRLASRRRIPSALILVGIYIEHGRAQRNAGHQYLNRSLPIHVKLWLQPVSPLPRTAARAMAMRAAILLPRRVTTRHRRRAVPDPSRLADRCRPPSRC